MCVTGIRAFTGSERISMDYERIISSPAGIEEESMRIIEGELRERGFYEKKSYGQAELSVIKRVIHATADFDFADSLLFTFEEEPGLEAVFKADSPGEEPREKNIDIVTDTNMILSGLSKPAMKRLGAAACCLMSDEETVRQAKQRGITRAAASMERAAALYPEGIYVIGNAPTALIRIAELAAENRISPTLVIGVPVGFVNVTESKEFALKVFGAKHIPAVLSMGRKGGSTVAVAAMNALMYMFSGLSEPGKRN